MLSAARSGQFNGRRCLVLAAGQPFADDDDQQRAEPDAR
jgi:hypothetical protein